MSVKIWKGVCNGISGAGYKTELQSFRDANAVIVNQDDGEGGLEILLMNKEQAIDIALCILAELAPGMFYTLKKED